MEARSRQGAARALLGAVIAAAGVALAVALRHAGEAVYYIPPYGVAIAVGGFVAAVAGAVLTWRSQRVALGLGAMLATVLGVGGLLAIVSIGVLLLLAAAAVCAVLAARTRAGPNRGLATAGGALLGAALPLLALTAFSPPLVDCGSGRSGENVFLALRSSSGSGGGSIGSDGRTSGRVSGDGYRYEYVCRDGTLVRFDLTTD